MRVHHLLSALAARGAEIRLVCPDESPTGATRTTTQDGIEQTAVPMGPRFHVASSRMSREWNANGFDIALAKSADRIPRFRQSVESNFPWADAILCHQPYLYPMIRNAPVPVVVDAMDIEGDLKENLAGAVGAFPGDEGREAVDFVRALERETLRGAAAVLAMGPHDAARLEWLYDLDPARIHEVGNGAPPPVVPWRPSPNERREARTRLGLNPDRPVVLYFGSGHPPNVESARLILRRIAPRVSGADFVIAGGLSWVLKNEERPGNAILRYETYGEERELLYRAAEVGLNPVVRRLPGSDIKVLDYLAHGVPVVATALGVRGFQFTDGYQYYPLDCDWGEEVANVLHNEMLSNHLAHHGLARVRELSWERRAEDAWGVVTDVIERRAAAAPSAPDSRSALPSPEPSIPPSGPEANARLALIEFRRCADTVTTTPAELVFDLTNGCHLRCLQCFRSYAEVQPTFLPWEAFERIPRRYFENALQIDLSGNGEPMLHPQWDSILENVADGGKQFITFNTSLTLTNEHRLRRMVELGVCLSVSIDGATKETYERIRRGASHAEVFGAMARLMELNRMDPHPRFNLRILWTVNTLNFHELPLLVLAAHDLGIRELHVHPLVATYPALIPYVCDPSGVEFVATALRAYEYAKAHNIRLDIAGSLLIHPDLRVATEENARIEYPIADIRWHHHLPDTNGCSFPWTQLNIDSRGDVVACCFADSKMGNVLGMDLDEIWNGFRFARLRRDLATVGSSGYCTECPSAGVCCPRIQCLRQQGVIPAHECASS